MQNTEILQLQHLVEMRKSIQSLYATACEASRNQAGRMSGSVDSTERDFLESSWHDYKSACDAYAIERSKQIEVNHGN